MCGGFFLFLVFLLEKSRVRKEREKKRGKKIHPSHSNLITTRTWFPRPHGYYVPYVLCMALKIKCNEIDSVAVSSSAIQPLFGLEGKCRGEGLLSADHLSPVYVLRFYTQNPHGDNHAGQHDREQKGHCLFVVFFVLFYLFSFYFGRVK